MAEMENFVPQFLEVFPKFFSVFLEGFHDDFVFFHEDSLQISEFLLNPSPEVGFFNPSHDLLNYLAVFEKILSTLEHVNNFFDF